jgi:hypothetical protein
MEIVVEELFIQQLQKFPIEFQENSEKFTASSTVNNHKLYIDQSRIGLLVKDNKLYILCFLYNQYF